MNINISLSSDKYIYEVIEFHHRISKTWDKKININVFIDEIYNPITSSLDFVYNIEKCQQIKNFQTLECHKLIQDYSKIIDTNLFKSDLRLHSNVLSSEEMILKQAKLCYLIDSKTSTDDFLSFTFGGTNIVHSILFKFSNFKNVFTYRIHNAINLEPGLKTNRVWFSPNNEMKLCSTHPRFIHNLERVNYKVDEIVDSLVNGIKRETLNKKFVSRRYPNTLVSFFSETLKLIYLFITFDKRYKKYFVRIKSLFNSLVIPLLYKDFNSISKPYFFFALNVPTDSQILVRASYFRDFISLISLIADSIPFNHYLIIREHPSFPGMLDYKELKRLLRKKENIKLVSHRESFFDLVKKSKSVLIINNTSYLESIILGKPVLALGIGPFTSQNILHEITNFRKLGDTLNTYNSKTNINQLKKFLNNWYLETFPLIDSNLANSKRKIDLTLDGIFEKISLHLSFSLTKTIDDL
jgi:hypothetical protein